MGCSRDPLADPGNYCLSNLSLKRSPLTWAFFSNEKINTIPAGESSSLFRVFFWKQRDCDNARKILIFGRVLASRTVELMYFSREVRLYEARLTKIGEF